MRREEIRATWYFSEFDRPDTFCKSNRTIHHEHTLFKPLCILCSFFDWKILLVLPHVRHIIAIISSKKRQFWPVSVFLIDNVSMTLFFFSSFSLIGIWIKTLPYRDLWVFFVCFEISGVERGYFADSRKTCRLSRAVNFFPQEKFILIWKSFPYYAIVNCNFGTVH